MLYDFRPCNGGIFTPCGALKELVNKGLYSAVGSAILPVDKTHRGTEMKIVKIETLKPGSIFGHTGFGEDDGSGQAAFHCVVVDKNISGPILAKTCNFQVVYCHIPSGIVSYSYDGYNVRVPD